MSEILENLKTELTKLPKEEQLEAVQSIIMYLLGLDQMVELYKKLKAVIPIKAASEDEE